MDADADEPVPLGGSDSDPVCWGGSGVVTVWWCDGVRWGGGLGSWGGLVVRLMFRVEVFPHVFAFFSSFFPSVVIGVGFE